MVSFILDLLKYSPFAVPHPIPSPPNKQQQNSKIDSLSNQIRIGGPFMRVSFF